MEVCVTLPPPGVDDVVTTMLDDGGIDDEAAVVTVVLLPLLDMTIVELLVPAALLDMLAELLVTVVETTEPEPVAVAVATSLVTSPDPDWPMTEETAARARIAKRKAIFTGEVTGRSRGGLFRRRQFRA